MKLCVSDFFETQCRTTVWNGFHLKLQSRRRAPDDYISLVGGRIESMATYFSAFGSICDMLTFTILTFNLWPSNNVVSSLVRLRLKGNLVYAWSLCDPMTWTFHSLIIKWHSGYNNYYIEKLVYWIWSFSNFLCLCRRKPSPVQKAIETGRLFLRNAWKGLILVSNTVI